MTALYLVLDQGGHASRAFVYDDAGRLLGHARKALHPSLHNGRVEYDAEAVAASLREALSHVLAPLGRRRRLLRAAALATQRSNIACWDRRTGIPCSPVIAWQDRRAAQDMAELGAGERQLIHECTGLPPSPHYGAGKLRWCLERLPQVQAARDGGHLALGPMAAYLVHRLAGPACPAVDNVNASRTLLWNLHRRRWDPRLLDLFHIPADVLPPCVPCRHDFGALTSGDLALPLQVVTGDQAAALFARGRPDSRTVYLTLGPGAFLLRPVGPAPPAADSLLASIVHDDAQGPLYALEGTINGAGHALRWFADQCDMRPDHDRLNALLASHVNPPLFLNGIGGLGTPFMVADFPSRFEGEGDPDLRWLAVLESILFLVRLNLETLARVIQPPAEAMEVGGGLSRLDLPAQREEKGGKGGEKASLQIPEGGPRLRLL